MLAQVLSLSRTTVTLALQALADKGLIVSRPRSGYFVADAFQTALLVGRKDLGQESPARVANWRERLQLHRSGA